MTLQRRLRENSEAILGRWLEAALAVYADPSAAAFARQREPFANPVGHRIREGTRGLFEALLDGMDPEAIARHLHEIVSVRAVQELSASQAVRFVFELKDAVRSAVGGQAEAEELAELERRIDRLALAAFDVFVGCRERLAELRINEVKRQVSWVVGKMNAKRGGQSPVSEDGKGDSPRTP